MKTFTVECEWDDEAKVWFISDSHVPGLTGEAATVEELSELLRSRIPELLALNCPDDIRQEREVPWQLIAKKQGRIALATCCRMSGFTFELKRILRGAGC